jgi:hypothetical protein
VKVTPHFGQHTCRVPPSLRFLQGAGAVDRHIFPAELGLTSLHAHGSEALLGAGDLHFIRCSCYQRKPWLDTDERRDLFLRILEEVRKEHRFVVLGYVVMPEHFHLLISEPQVGTPSTAMQSCETAARAESCA